MRSRIIKLVQISLLVNQLNQLKNFFSIFLKNFLFVKLAILIILLTSEFIVFNNILEITLIQTIFTLLQALFKSLKILTSLHKDQYNQRLVLDFYMLISKPSNRGNYKSEHPQVNKSKNIKKLNKIKKIKLLQVILSI